MREQHPLAFELVDVEDACTFCGERDMDQLVWLDGDTVGCGNCGTRYQPLANLAAKGGDHAAEA